MAIATEAFPSLLVLGQPAALLTGMWSDGEWTSSPGSILPGPGTELCGKEGWHVS